MSLDDRLEDMGESYYPFHEYGKAYAESNAEKKTTAKQAILTDLLEIIGETEHSTVVSKEDIEDELDGGNAVTLKQKATTARNQLRQELTDKVRKYCE